MIFNSEAQTVSLLQDKIASLQISTRRFLANKVTSAEDCLRLLGLMVSSLEAIPYSHFHLRALKTAFLSTRQSSHRSRGGSTATIFPVVRTRNIGILHPGSVKLGSSLPEQEYFRSGRVVTSPKGILGHSRKIWRTGDRPHGIIQE